MDSQRSTASNAGSPVAQAALVALANTLSMDPTMLRPVLESAFDKVQAGLAPGVALKMSCARLGYNYDPKAFDQLLQAFQGAFSGMFARSSVTVASNAVAAVPERQHLSAPRGPSPFPSQVSVPQMRPSSSDSNFHHELSSGLPFYRYYELLGEQLQTVPGYWPADSGPAFDPCPPPPMGLMEIEQTSTILPNFTLQSHRLGYYHPPPKPTNWFRQSRQTDSIEEWQRGIGKRPA